MDYSDEMRRARERYESTDAGRRAAEAFETRKPYASSNRRAADAERRLLRQEQALALAELGRVFGAVLAVADPPAIAHVVVAASAGQHPSFIPFLVKSMKDAERERRKDAGRAARLAARPTLTCPSCATAFKGHGPGARYCSSPCRQAAYRARKRTAAPSI